VGGARRTGTGLSRTSTALSCLTSLLLASILAVPALAAVAAASADNAAALRKVMTTDDQLAGRVLLVRDAGAWKVSERVLRVLF
jgi:hypothetical protein